MSTIVSGALLHAGVDGGIESVLVDDFKSIQGFVGGHFDCVRIEAADGTVIVGYVHDEGLLLGMEMNWLASALFQRELVGPCVIVGGTSPNGVYDGENYDLPKGFFQFLNGTFKEHVRSCLVESMIMTAGIDLMHSKGFITDDELEQLDKALKARDDDAIGEWMETMSNRVEEVVVSKETENLDDELSKLLEGK
jgi:hypothetical protein